LKKHSLKKQQPTSLFQSPYHSTVGQQTIISKIS